MTANEQTLVAMIDRMLLASPIDDDTTMIAVEPDDLRRIRDRLEAFHAKPRIDATAEAKIRELVLWGFRERKSGNEVTDAIVSALAALQSPPPVVSGDVPRLRKALIEAGRHAGCLLSDDVSTDFLMHVPEEVRLKLSTPATAQGDAREALEQIANWQMPETDKFWDKERTRPMSYGTCYGAAGERNVIVSIAKKALATLGAAHEG